MKCVICGRKAWGLDIEERRPIFHHFPKNEDRKNKWLAAIGKPFNTVINAKNDSVCSYHFNEDHAYSKTLKRKVLLSSAIPSINLGLISSKQKAIDVPLTKNKFTYVIPKLLGRIRHVYSQTDKKLFMDKGVQCEIITTSPATPIMKSTFMSLQSKLAYIIYNDQPPNSQSSGSSYGHTKGILATDGKTGFWLVHSIPKYPNKPEDGVYDYPENAKSNGQSGICLTFDFRTLPDLVNLMRYNKPNIYSKNTQKFMDRFPAEIKNFFTNKRPLYVKKAPFNISTQVKSLAGKSFSVFAKHPKWDKELYDDAIAPTLKASLIVETWRNGAGGKLDADCKDNYTVYNVDDVEIDFKGQTVPNILNFPRTVDHSKWAVSQQGNPTWACVADINRMDSQKRRGGGAVCLNDLSVWKAYYAIIDKYEGCKI